MNNLTLSRQHVEIIIHVAETAGKYKTAEFWREKLKQRDRELIESVR